MPIQQLDLDVMACRQCKRLVKWREAVSVTKRRQFMDDTYWGKAVPSFGRGDAELLIVGLAPAAHGANRTGRMFTGDRSGDWLYKALHKAGFANQPTSVSVNDGLKLNNCRISAVAHCAPPQNKLTRDEIVNCQPFLQQELLLMSQVKAVLCLGKLSWDETLRVLYSSPTLVERFNVPLTDTGKPPKRPTFGHNAHILLSHKLSLFGSYHPSQQNTFTKRLTEPMFDAVFADINAYLKS